MNGVYYNEFDAYAASWLEKLMSKGEVPVGNVDRRNIRSVPEVELDGGRTCHFFAGIGGWALALKIAGWADGPVWTGSCPCQPFSQAGKQKGEADERHLWPEFRRLIAHCCPTTIFGEQVASRAGREWLAGVRSDLEALGYAVGAADLCAASAAAPHIRQRLFWVANTDVVIGRQGRANHGWSGGRSREKSRSGPCDDFGDMGNSHQSRLEGRQGEPNDLEPKLQATQRASGNAWSDYSVVECSDGNSRRINTESGDEPLAFRFPKHVGRRKPELAGLARRSGKNRVGRLRGYGNAIVPQLAAIFIRSFLEAKHER